MNKMANKPHKILKAIQKPLEICLVATLALSSIIGCEKNWVKEESERVFYKKYKSGEINISHNYLVFIDSDGDRKTAERVILERPITNSWTLPETIFYAQNEIRDYLKLCFNERIMTASEYERFNNEYQELLRHIGEPAPLTPMDDRGVYFKYKN